MTSFTLAMDVPLSYQEAFDQFMITIQSLRKYRVQRADPRFGMVQLQTGDGILIAHINYACMLRPLPDPRQGTNLNVTASNIALWDPLGLLSGPVTEIMNAYHYQVHWLRDIQNKVNAGLACPRCGRPVPPGSLACPGDGTPIYQPCPSCRCPNLPGAAECSGCGVKLSPIKSTQASPPA